MKNRRKTSREELESRLEQARLWFRQHHANVEPDASFAGRVTSNLRREPAEMMGQVALRLLPASVAIILILAWFTFQVSPQAQTAGVTSGDEDLLTWVLDRPEEVP